MHRLLPLAAVAGCLCLATPSWTQDALQEKTRVLCDETDPENHCPGRECRCVADTLEITFDGGTRSILEYEALSGDLPVDVTVITETESDIVQGWSYGVAHDPGVLTLEHATVERTVADPDPGRGVILFDATSMEDIQTCGPDPECSRENRTDGGGWITAIVFFGSPYYLPLRRNSIAQAQYVLTQDVGEEGTLIHFTSRLARTSSPPTDVNLTVDGRSVLWTTAIEGWIKRKTDNEPFVRADSNGDGRRDVTDTVLMIRGVATDLTVPLPGADALDANDDGNLDLADGVYLLTYLFASGQHPPEPFPTCEPDPTPDVLTCDSFLSCP